MISLYKAIFTGKYTELFTYRNPIEYGYKIEGVFRDLKRLKTDEEKVENTKVSTKRAKDKMKRLITGNMYHSKQFKPVFLTLTYKENFQSLDMANIDFTKFIKRFNYRLGYPLKYIAVPEFQDRGAVHYHLIIFNMPFIKGQEIEQMWGHGSTDIKLVTRHRGLWKYLVPYVGKTFKDERFRGKKRYFYSLDNHSKETHDFDEINEVIKTLTSEDLIAEYQYTIQDKNGIEVNQVKKQEFLAGGEMGI
jgi:hypothetical protein